MTLTTQPLPNRSPYRWGRNVLLSATAVLATGCASVPNPHPDDPLESYNRSMFAVNEAIDGALLKPIAHGYVALTPEPVRTCVSNVFGNLADVWSAVNSFLQARGHDFFNTLGRVMFNSTMGLGGCIDVASMNGSKRITNDLGVTLGVWGLKSGPYIVLPFWGSSNARDGGALLGALAADISPITPVFSIDNVPLRNSILGLYGVSSRAQLLDADKLVDDIALDRYSFIRDAYMQRRKALVDQRLHNGELPDYSDDLPDYSDPDEANPGTTNATPLAPTAD